MVSRVTDNGIVVIIPEFGIENKVKLNASKGGADFEFNQTTLTLREVKTGLAIQIFDQVKVNIDVQIGSGRREKLVVQLLEPTFGQKRPADNSHATAENGTKKHKL